MEGLGGVGFSNVPDAARKKRSNTSRRPRSDSQALSDFRDISSLSSTPPSENAEFGQNMNKLGNGGSGESDEASDNGSFLDSIEQRHSGDNSKRHSEGVLAPANWRSTNSMGHSGTVCDGLGNETKVKKVKLKVGGVTHTINAKSTPDAAAGAGSPSAKSYHYSDASRPRQKFIFQENSDDNRSFSSDNGDSLQGLTWKDLPGSGLRADGSRNRTPYENMTNKQTATYKPVRKSKRVPKRRSVGGVLDNGSDDDDEEVRYLEKVRKSKVNADYGVEYVDDEEGGSRKQLKISSVLKRNVDDLYDVDASDYRSTRSGKDSKKSRSGRVSEDIDYLEEEEPVSDGEPEINKKKAKREFIDVLGDSKKEMTVTTRRRALQAGKDVSSSSGASLIEFPNGLPPVPPRKQKEKLSEVEQQLKRAEALQRRRMQVEKAARESQAEAIRKILGQDSSRKKREDKVKKRQEELAQEKAANAMILASDTVRWIMGPSGTVVTFPNEVGLPSIFDHKPCSYPPPREKCAAPSCTNPYKYRDSKSKLPLCSLQCYKAIHGSMPSVSAC